MEMETELTLGNCERDNNYLSVHPDYGGMGNKNMVGFNVTIEGKRMPLSEKKSNPDDGGEEYFHINKAQVKVLISYLTDLYNDM